MRLFDHLESAGLNYFSGLVAELKYINTPVKVVQRKVHQLARGGKFL